MERTGKYEKFPTLKSGDLVVCGEHTAYIVTGGGSYKLRESSDPDESAALVGHVGDLESLLDYGYPEYTPEAVFRPSKGFGISSYVISIALADWRDARIFFGERFSRIWSIDDDETKELTVDEVSEKLGYKIKIVGSAK